MSFDMFAADSDVPMLACVFFLSCKVFTLVYGLYVNLLQCVCYSTPFNITNVAVSISSEEVERCQKWSDNITQQIDLAFNIFFMVYFFIRVS